MVRAINEVARIIEGKLLAVYDTEFHDDLGLWIPL